MYENRRTALRNDVESYPQIIDKQHIELKRTKLD